MNTIQLDKDRFGNFRITPKELAEVYAFIIMEQEQLLQMVIAVPEDAAVTILRNGNLNAGRFDLLLTDHLYKQIYRSCLEFARRSGIPTFYDFYTGDQQPLAKSELQPASKRLVQMFRQVMGAAA
jgi:hypothetical protein